jgi:signal transduction histidine kinase
MLNIFLVLIIFVLSFVLFVQDKKNKKNIVYKKTIESYLKKVIRTMSNIRYGNFQQKIEDGFCPVTSDLTKVLNSSLESILDRENMIQEYITREKEAQNLKTDFIASLTHDLKVPIIAQDKTFDLLLDGKFGELNETQKEALSNIKISNMDLKYLIEALLETYKLEKAKLELNISYGVDVILAVKEIISQIEPIAVAHNSVINFICSKTDIVADIDTFLIKRVLHNLVLNALTYSSSQTVDISLSTSGDNLKIDVKDYGVGIDEAEVKKIFDKFYSGNTKYLKSSTGLGLYISNKIVKLHKGKLSVSSKENEGTTFSIVLPLKYEQNVEIQNAHNIVAQ